MMEDSFRGVEEELEREYSARDSQPFQEDHVRLFFSRLVFKVSISRIRYITWCDLHYLGKDNEKMNTLFID